MLSIIERPSPLELATEKLRKATDRLLEMKDRLDAANVSLAAENARARQWLDDNPVNPRAFRRF